MGKDNPQIKVDACGKKKFSPRCDYVTDLRGGEISDRFNNRWAVIRTIKEEKQKRRSADKLCKQADGKKKQR